MQLEDVSINPTVRNTTLWRYMSFTKFVSLLTKKSLFFARADKLRDPFEGSLPRQNISRLPQTNKGKPEKQWRQIGPFIKILGQYTLVSCWHENEYESDAMWKLYSGAEDGIAIKTDLEALSGNLIGERCVPVKKVTYVDYDTSTINPMDTLAPFIHKRKGFEHENEVRALIVEAASGQPVAGAASGFATLESILENPPEPYKVGTYQEVNIPKLIREVVVTPFAADWFVELVQTAAETLKLHAPVRRSSLSVKPMWV